MYTRDIFICYSHADAVDAARVAAYLENHGGFTCWYAHRDLIESDESENPDSILNEINDCAVFLFISSPNTSDSQWVAASHALALDKDRFELKIEDGEISNQAFLSCYEQLSRLLKSEIQLDESYDEENLSGFGKRLVYIMILIIGVAGAVLTFNSLSGRLEEQMIAAEEEAQPNMRVLLTERAQEGEAAAQYEMGRLLMIVQDFDEAVYWYRKAALQGHRGAQSELAINYHRGIGTDRNHIQAAYWFYKAGDVTDPFYQFTIGQMYRDGNLLDWNRELAKYWFQMAAENELSEAQVSLGFMLVEDNEFEQAIYWYRRAAERGDVYAQSNLGLMYSLGQGVAPSQEEAIRWFRLAAERDMPGAQVNLGWMYEFGQGVERDTEQAAYWYLRAAELGYVNGMNNYGVVAYSKQQYETAIYWFRQAAERSDPRGMGLLGYMYENGNGIEQCDESAIFWYEQALMHGQAWVAERLQFLLNDLE